MKKYLNMFVCAACAVALLSCEKEKEAPEVAEDGIVPPGYTMETLRGESEQTKTTIDNGVTLWAAYDQIKVICSDNSVSNFTIRDGVGTNTGDFQGLVPEGKTAVYAVYPASSYSSASGSTVKVNIPAEQTGVFGAGNLAVAKVDTDRHMAFKNVNAFISFTIPAEITKVVISSVSGAGLSGTLSVACSGDAPAAGALENGGPSITVTFPDSDGGTYYISVAPGVNHPKGLLLTYYKGEEVSGTYYLNKNITTAANTNITMGTVEAEGNYYVTVDGAGNKNGMSWENAFSAEQMWKKLHLAGTDEATDEAKLAAIDGATFHLGAGEYNMGADPSLSFDEDEAITLTFKGGYPAAGGSRNLDNYETAFSGNNEHAALILSGRMNVTLDGVGIIKGSSSASDEAALQCSGANLSVTMLDCKVRNNTNSSNTAGLNLDTVGGGFTAERVTFSYNSANTKAAMSIVNTAVTMTDCVFDHNTSSDHSSVFRSNSGGMTSTFTRCTFSNNTASGTNGGAILRHAGRLEFIDCTFTGNTVGTSSSGYGGAISTTSNGTGTIYISGGTFSGNQAYNGGCIAMRTGWLDAKDITFEDNVSTGRAAVVYTEKTVNLSQCTVRRNHGKWGGAAYVKGDGETLQIYGGLWEDNYAYNGGAILAGNAGSVTVGVSKGVGTTFSGNYSTGGKGGAIRNEGSGNISVKGATFTGNSTRCTTTGGDDNYYGGAIATEHSNSVVTITDTEFIGNYSLMYGGAALSYQSGDSGDHTGSLTVTGCTFNGNYNGYTGTDNPAHAKYCGAVRLGNDTTPAYFADCVFTGNYTRQSNSLQMSSSGGAVCIYADNKCFFDKCHFEGNYSTRGSAICAAFSTNAASSVFLNACSFKGNWASWTWGPTIYVEGIPTFCMNNCTIADDTYSVAASTAYQGCWMDIEPDKVCVISNCSFIGSARNSSGVLTTEQSLLYLCGLDSGKYRLINDLIVANNGHYSVAAETQGVKMYGTKYGTFKNKGNSSVSGTYNSNHVASDFSSLAWNSDDCVWTWTGTVSNGDTRIGASDFDTELNDACSDFKTWLDDIGATHKDQLGNDRGSVNWWPGAYQDSQGSNGLLKVITWNICSDPSDNIADHSWNARRGGMAAFINDRLPHIICMQECEPDPRNYLTGNCSGYSAVYDNTSLSLMDQLSGKTNSYNVILYKTSDISVQSSGTFWLTSGAPTTPTKSSDQNSYRSCTWMKCIYQGQKMLVLDTHLSYRTKNNSTVNSDDVVALRQTEMGVIKTWINGHYNPSNDGWLLFMGDMNASHYEAIFDEWKDGTYGYFSRDACPGAATGRTYNDWDWENGSVSTIDFQFYKGFPSVKSYKIPTETYSNVVYLSDHWPVVVEYRMN